MPANFMEAGLGSMYKPKASKASTSSSQSTSYLDKAKSFAKRAYNKLFGSTPENPNYTKHGIKKFQIPVKPQGEDPDGEAYAKYERLYNEYMDCGAWPGEPKDVGSAAWNEWHEQSKAYLDWKALTLARKLDAEGAQYGDPLRLHMDDFYQELE